MKDTRLIMKNIIKTPIKNEEIEARIIKLAGKIEMNSLLSACSYARLNYKVPKEPIYKDEDTNDVLSRAWTGDFVGYMGYFAIYKQIGMPIHDNDQSFLLSSLVSDKQIDYVKAKMYELAQMYINNNTRNDWHIMTIETPSNTATLLDVFVTNSNMPQVVLLGANIACKILQLSKNNELPSSQFIKSIANIGRLQYHYHTENPLDYYKDNLISLTKDSQAFEKLNHLFSDYISNDSDLSCYDDDVVCDTITKNTGRISSWLYINKITITPYNLMDLFDGMLVSRELTTNETLMKDSTYKDVINYLASIINK